MTETIMAMEAAQLPYIIKQQLLKNAEPCQQLGDMLRNKPPQFVYIIGRGSSDHAGVFAKYLIEVELGIPVCSAAPSMKHLAIVNIDLNDETTHSHQQQIAEMEKRGASIIQLASLVKNIHPRIAPLTIIQRFYLDVEHISVAMGLNPDAPSGLNKVTQTI